MSVRTQIGAAAVAVFALLLSACQGNLGTGSGGGIALPQTPGYGQPAPGAPAAQSRQRVLDGAVEPVADMNAIPLPSLDGFSVTIALGTPTPAPSPSSSPSAAPAAGGRARGGGGRATGRRGATAAPSAALSPQPSPSSAGGSPQPGASGGASGGPSAGGAAGGASGTASGGPSAQPSDLSRASKITTKTTIYPDDAPAPPSPQPSGNVQTFVKRTPLVRGFLVPVDDVALYGLGAVRFTVPASEAGVQRGFTVAVFEAGKKHHEKLVASDTQAVVADASVASALTNDPFTFKKNVGYLVMLYGDELPPTPAPAASGYPAPGNNPFVTPIPSGYPGGPGGPPAGPASAPPFGTATLAPGVAPSHF